MGSGKTCGACDGGGKCAGKGRPTTGGAPSVGEITSTPPRAGVPAHVEHAERLITLGTMAALIAHEFNNILTPVASYAQMALARPEDAALASKALERALAGSERAAQIAEVILGFARHDTRSTWNADPEAAEPPSASVREGVDAALASLVRPLEHDGVQVDVRLPALLALKMRPVCLQHVLLNLLLNARTAMMPGGGRLTITARHTAPIAVEGASKNGSRLFPGGTTPAEPDHSVSPCHDDRGGTVEVTITDTGRGMSIEQLTNLFTPFLTYSNHEAAAGIGEFSERRRGSGLGMTICKRLVEDVGGAIRVQSTPGQGTTVRLVIPAARVGASTSVAAA